MKTTKLGLIVSTLCLSLPAAAFAQDVDGDGADEEQVDGAGKPTSAPNDGDLPAPKSDNDPQPEVATPAVPAGGGIVKQAGVGGDIGYGRAGVLELGGAASFRAGSGFSQASVSPSVGWFLADNFQISAMFDLGYVEQNDDSTMLTSLLLEPSYHIPFNRSVFAFLGIGLGGAHVEDLGLGFATAPRVGMNVMVGRSGILTPSISWQYTTHDKETMDTGDNTQTTTLAVSSAARFNIGYTVMW